MLGITERQFAPEAADSDVTVGQYAERWLAQVKASSKPRTVENYAASLRVHILPQWGAVKVREIHRAAVEEGMRTLYDDGMAKATMSNTLVTVGRRSPRR